MASLPCESLCESPSSLGRGGDNIKGSQNGTRGIGSLNLRFSESRWIQTSLGSVESVETSSGKTKERSRDDFSIWFRPGASLVVFMILPAMILLNQNFGKIMAGKIMKTKALTCYGQLVITTKRGSYCGPVPERYKSFRPLANLAKPRMLKALREAASEML